MCLILLAWQAHPDYPLVVAANRDEFFSRPSAPVAFWQDAPQLLAGRDLDAGGTWLGVNRYGRFGALTNYREGRQAAANAPSRGALVTNFLLENDDPATYLDRLAARGAHYNGFNLLVGEGLGQVDGTQQRLGYYSNRSTAPRWLTPGIYGLSNHLLDTPWPKLATAKAAFTAALQNLPSETAFFKLLADPEIVPDTHLPETGVPLEWERILSAIFVSSPDYGTRASSLLTIDREGAVMLAERSFGAGAKRLGDVVKRFQSSQISTGV